VLLIVSIFNLTNVTVVLGAQNISKFSLPLYISDVPFSEGKPVECPNIEKGSIHVHPEHDPEEFDSDYALLNLTNSSNKSNAAINEDYYKPKV
jgi:hypothetical protein